MVNNITEYSERARAPHAPQAAPGCGPSIPHQHSVQRGPVRRPNTVRHRDRAPVTNPIPQTAASLDRYPATPNTHSYTPRTRTHHTSSFLRAVHYTLTVVCCSPRRGHLEEHRQNRHTTDVVTVQILTQRAADGLSPP